MLKLLKLVVWILSLSSIVKFHYDPLLVVVNSLYKSNIAVEHSDSFLLGKSARRIQYLPLLLVIVLDLHDLIALSEHHIAPVMLGLSVSLRIEDILKLLVEVLNTHIILTHRCQHLYIRFIHTKI